MNVDKLGSRFSKFWIFQIAIGSICILLSIIVLFYGATSTAAAYIWLFLAGVGLLILGAERLASGLLSKGVSRLSRIINICAGAGLIIYIGSGFFFPFFATKWLIIFLGFGLLANGALRIFGALKNKEGESRDFSSLALGIVITSISIVVLTYPNFGLALLLVLTAIALAISGIQIILAGLKAKRKSHPKIQEDKLTSPLPQDDNKETAKVINGFWKSGSWLRDKEKRYVLFRGVNFGSRSKLPPYLPIAPLGIKELARIDLNKEIESVKLELDLLKKLGFNVIRLLISWKAIEPRPNSNLDELLPEGKKYLSYMREIIDELYKRDLYVILDFHQDIANEIYGGDGFPDWALVIDEEHEKPKIAQPDKKWQLKYMMNKSLKQTYKSFWDNKLTNSEEGLKNYPVRTHLEKTIGQTVKFFNSYNNGFAHPGILGIEPFNEPHPSTIPKKDFELKFLMNFYYNVSTEVKKVNKNIFIFLEPRVDWTVSSAEGGMPVNYGVSPLSIKDSFNMDFIKKIMVDKELVSKKLTTYLPMDISSISNFGNNGVLSFHYYDAMAVASSFVRIPESMYTYKMAFPKIFGELQRAATERGLVPFLTEFGAFQEAEQIREYLNLQFTQIEAYLLNSTIWNYDLYNTEDGKDNWNFENYSILGPERKPRNIDVVARPYPMRSSAKPSLLFFDIDTKYASIILEGEVISKEPTIIYVPFELHYAPEFTIWSTSGEINWDKKNSLLLWFPSNKYSYNQLIIGKKNKLEIEILPDQSKQLIDKTTFTTTFS
jgi:uncharacterized membrane protein HdeD (DUF308 family)